MAFLGTLVGEMTKVSPDDRPTIHEAMKKFDTIKASLSQRSLGQRLRPADSEWFVSRVVNDVQYRIRDMGWARNVKAVELPPFV